MDPCCYEVAVPAEPASLKLVRGFFESVLVAQGTAGVPDLLLALDEACANVVRHRREPVDDGVLRVRLEILATGLRFRLFRFCESCDVPHIRPHECTDARPGGFGTGLIGRIMDRVGFERQAAPPHFLDLVLIKDLPSGEVRS